MCWVIQSSRSSTVLNTSVRCCSQPILLYRTAQSLCSGICPDPHVQTQAWVSRCVHRSRRRPLLLWLLVFDCIGLVLLVLSLCGIIARCCHCVCGRSDECFCRWSSADSPAAGELPELRAQAGRHLGGTRQHHGHSSSQRTRSVEGRPRDREESAEQQPGQLPLQHE